MPAGWKWVRLGDISDCRLGKTPRRANYRDEGNYRIIKFRDVNEGAVDFGENSLGYVVDDIGALRGLREISNGDTLLTASAHSPEQIGRKCAFIENLPLGFTKIFFVGELLAISPNQDYVHPLWPYYWFQSVEGIEGVQEAISGVHQRRSPESPHSTSPTKRPNSYFHLPKQTDGCGGKGEEGCERTIGSCIGPVESLS